MWRLIGNAEPQALLLLIRNGGEWPTGSITTPLPKLLKPRVFIQRAVKLRQHPQNVKRLRWLSLFQYIMHCAAVVCVEICLLCLIHLHIWACSTLCTYISAHTIYGAHTNMQHTAICYSFVQSNSLSQCFWQHAREVASVGVGQSLTRGEERKI